MYHTFACKAHQFDICVAKQKYENSWPNYCRKCGGKGGTEYCYDPSPSGISLGMGTMAGFDPCPECVEKGICPRCGLEVWNENSWDTEGVVCPKCKWEEKNPEVCPEFEECGCWWDLKEERFNSLGGK